MGLEREQALEQEHILQESSANELLQGCELLLSVIDSGPDWIFATDRNHKLLLVSHNMTLALGYKNSDELIGQYDCQVLQRADCFKNDNTHRCSWHDDEMKVYEGKTVYQPQERITLPNKQCIFLESYKSPLRDNNGNIVGVLCFRRNITERLKVEEENRQLERELWQAKKMEAIGQLAGGIAHDFNHLLSLILGYSQFAQTALVNNNFSKLDNYLTEILKAASDGQTVVAQLLAFSRTDNVVEERINIAPIIVETADTLRALLAEHHAFDLQIASDLPAVKVKSTQIKQIITNLFLNARDAIISQPEQKAGSIKIRLYRDPISAAHSCSSCKKSYQGAHLILSVWDNGIGISPQLLDRLFEPFFTTKDIGKGSGLGLPMVHGITHSLGGHIQVVSTPAKGTTFLVRIPEN